MSSVTSVLELAGALVVSLATLGGAFLWLVWPRVEEKIEEVAGGVRRVVAATSGDLPDTLHRYAHVAATRSAEIPEISERLERLVSAQLDFAGWQDRTDERITHLERQLVDLLATLAELLSREVRHSVTDAGGRRQP